METKEKVKGKTPQKDLLLGVLQSATKNGLRSYDVPMNVPTRFVYDVKIWKKPTQFWNNKSNNFMRASRFAILKSFALANFTRVAKTTKSWQCNTCKAPTKKLSKSWTLKSTSLIKRTTDSRPSLTYSWRTKLWLTTLKSTEKKWTTSHLRTIL